MFVTVSPSFSSYNHSTGEIEDYGEAEYKQGKVQHTYVYYKNFYRRTDSADVKQT